MDEEFLNFRTKENETYNDVLKSLDERGNEPPQPKKTSKSKSVIENSSSTDSLAPIFNPDSSAKTSTQKGARGRGASGRGRGRGASTSTAANETKNTSRSTSKSKMPTLMESLGTASKRPQRGSTKAADVSKTIYIDDSD